MYEDETFYFISKGDPVSTIERFIRDYSLQPQLKEWEYPNSGESSEYVFHSFIEILDFLLKKGNVQYPFYFTNSEGDLFFVGVSLDGTIVFGIPFNGEEAIELANVAKRYEAEYGYVVFATFPELGGLQKFRWDDSYPIPVAYKDSTVTIVGNW